MSQDAEILRQILDQIRCADSPSETSRQVRPLRALTQQLKRTSAASPSLRSTDGATQVLEELQTLRLKIDSNLQLLELFITFLRTSRQVRAPDCVQDSSSRALLNCRGACSHKI